MHNVHPPAAFWQYDAGYWFQKLQSSASGLSEMEATLRYNALNERAVKKSSFQKNIHLFVRQFKSPLMLLLIGAVILSAFLGDASDVFIILFIVLSSGLMSFFQERNAGKVIERLQSLIALKCTVIREGAPVEIPSGQVVPGDVLLLHAGDMIPADCLVIESNQLYINEASLTGESYPGAKEPGVLDEHTGLLHRSNSLWQGTSVVSGSGKALVIHTGQDTLFRNITRSVSEVVETSFEKGIRNFGFLLMKITLLLSSFILLVNLLTGKTILESGLFALALAVGMAPELLPAVTTIAMSAGAKRLLAKRVLVNKLNAIQNLGEVDLLCTDKTGTITEGMIEVAEILNAVGEADEFVRELAYWNAAYQSGYANPIDEALKKMPARPRMQAAKTGELPYDFQRKRLSICIQSDNGHYLITKGACKELFTCCSKVRLGNETFCEMQTEKNRLNDLFAKFGNSGLRVIGVAYKEIKSAPVTVSEETDMIFAGFVLLQDPVKAGITEVIAELKQLAVSIKIITGDNRNIARSIARKLGIADPVIIAGEELAGIAPAALAEKAKHTHIFAEMEPQQKEQLIKALKTSYTVAYMGDGINDVSALNAADVGISVDNAADVAREAADFVLMEKDLSVLAEGIKEGRKTFANTMKYLYISTGSTFGNMISMAIASLLLPFLPMLPKQILLTNFITDFPYLAIPSDTVDEELVEKPGRWNMNLIRKYTIIFGIHSTLFDIITFLVLLYLLKAREAVFQTGWFIESVMTELLILFIIRTHQHFFKSNPSGPLILLTIIGVLVTLALPYLPFASDMGFVHLSLLNLGVMFGIVLLYILTADWLKVWFFRKYQSVQ
ncbi:MAG: magnesium-translocating P-type ATPase [Chitinophagaceae bacterium]|nr:magnesium-translocating P-type ATPase [Chitinophagaceae bacterium]